ncbi:hypothetical protein P700755_002952 [Psychroflexus torquis ATCC 700755]|uniref:Uncharacterized protein n=1 Tax=Psychroflexus torquis (strain ATCC 700755 / CIP 106069 / ACAM 623) TaxID=313595 RepID=K4IGL0_PSYTT|nr:hypothetical protein [Psychroflexus torquis]AFU69652.1 hypothetical protein P700755_002952 [Psychroflexus torquis ATCC 700755]
MNNADLEKEVKRLVHLNSYEKGLVCTVDIMLQLGYLTKKDYENWRFGRIEYLEKACNINLSKLTLINKLIRKYSMDLNLESSWTGYNQFGKGIKRKLRFSKSGKKSIEDSYATHYIDKKRIDELKKNKTSM